MTLAEWEEFLKGILIGMYLIGIWFPISYIIEELLPKSN